MHDSTKRWYVQWLSLRRALGQPNGTLTFVRGSLLPDRCGISHVCCDGLAEIVHSPHVKESLPHGIVVSVCHYVLVQRDDSDRGRLIDWPEEYEVEIDGSHALRPTPARSRPS